MEDLDIDIMFQMVLDSLPLFVFWKDRESRYLGCNQAFANAAGLNSPQEIIGKNDHQLIWSDQADHFIEDDQFVMNNNLPKLNIVEEQTQPDGIHWVETNKIPIKNKHGEVIGVLGSFHDITEKVKLQNEKVEREKREMVSTLAGGISHDLNNSLSLVSGLATLCLRQYENKDREEQVKDYLNKMQTAIKKSSLLAKRFMNFSKEQTEQTKQIIGAEGFLNDTCELLKSGFSLNLDLEIEGELPFVYFDESQLSQVINNLVLNAQQASGEFGKIKVNASAGQFKNITELDPEKNYIKVDVTDNGCGIAKDQIQDVFKAYYTTKATGNGLGLSSCLAIMKRHEGTIQVESELDVGTTFSLYIPEADVSNPDDYIVFTKELIRGKGTIFLVDDERNLRFTTQKQLEDLGYNVTGFSSGEAMIESLTSGEHCDLVITDYYLQENQFNGDDIFHATKKIKGDIPVILLSGYFKRENGKENFDYILRKPLDLPKLSQLIQHFLKNRKGR